MKRLVLDASVFIKIFLPQEEDCDKAKRLMHAIIDEQTELIAPRLFYYEVFAISGKHRIPSDAVWDILEDYEASLLHYVPENGLITKKALEICEAGNQKSGHPSFYDASYHALAILHDCDFITADKKHYAKTRQLGSVKLLSEIEV